MLYLLREIMQHAFGSLILGIVLTVLFVFLLFFIIRGFYKNAVFSPLSYLTGVVLVVLLIPQMIVFCGAFGLKMQCDEVEEWLDENVVKSENYIEPVPLSEQDCDNILEALIDNYPLVSAFVGGGEFKRFDTSNICHAIATELNSFLNEFIFKSLGWSLLFVIIGATIVIRTTDHCNKYNRQRRSPALTGMTGTARTPRGARLGRTRSRYR